MQKPAISVIIPTLNEERALDNCLERLKAVGVEELLVADGASSDATQEVARSHGARLVVVRGGRAQQCNAGAAQARGRIFCFLHSDTHLPPGWQSQLLDVIDAQGLAGGAFRFGLRGERRAWRVIEWGVNLRSRWLGLPYGDQALFVRREVFEELGGFKPMPFMEDVDFVIRLKRHGSLGLAFGRAVTSPRRWEEKGLFSTTIRNYIALTGYLLGISPSRLYRWYFKSGPESRPAGIEEQASLQEERALR